MRGYSRDIVAADNAETIVAITSQALTALFQVPVPWRRTPSNLMSIASPASRTSLSPLSTFVGEFWIGLLIFLAALAER